MCNRSSNCTNYNKVVNTYSKSKAANNTFLCLYVTAFVHPVTKPINILKRIPMISAGLLSAMAIQGHCIGEGFENLHDA